MNRIKLRIPVLFLVVAATAIPVEFRPLGSVRPSFDINDIPDVLANILGYIPIGIVLGELGPFTAVLTAALISLVAETGQLAMMHRDPSFTDVLSNIAGAGLGAFASARFGIRSPALRVSRWRGIIAAVGLLAVILHVRDLSDDRNNPDGTTSRGHIEASWKLGKASGREVPNSSGQDLAGRFQKDPVITAAGPDGGAAVFDGTNYVDFRNPAALRFTGSMTITAWINSSSYPIDDAVIISQLHGHRGYQLDTTIDRGARSIGFKLTDACGRLMARYGRSLLALNTWYHVAGVYNAQARTLDVYLNAQPDNGFLLGSVTGTQRSARGSTYAGRRGDSDEYNFSGAIAEVHIYSFALTKPQIAADMHGERIDAPVFQQSVRASPCAPLSDPEDKEIPADAAILGILAAVGLIGIWPSAKWPFMVIASLGAGLVLLTVTAPVLPAFNMWLLPLISLTGGACIAFSVRQNEF